MRGRAPFASVASAACPAYNQRVRRRIRSSPTSPHPRDNHRDGDRDPFSVGFHESNDPRDAHRLDTESPNRAAPDDSSFARIRCTTSRWRSDVCRRLRTD